MMFKGTCRDRPNSAAVRAWLVGVVLCLPGACGLVRAAATIPQDSDWVDYGVAIDAGRFGEANDVIFEGYNPGAAVKKDGTYYLYYVQSDDYISQKNNVGPARRSIGVATSTDGVRWTKYPGNPVITWSVTGNPEEGAPSIGVFVAANGDFVAYYGANTSAGPTSSTVRSDCRLAVSSDGFNFVDQGAVAARTDPNVWGYGDELHSVIAFENAGIWYCYYIPNGVAQASKLGVVWGSDRGDLPNSEPVLHQSNGTTVPARGASGVCMLDANTVAFFTSDPGRKVVARTTTLDALNRLSDPVATYYPGRLGKGLVYLDISRNTWFLYTNEWGYLGLKLAPAGPPDVTPPTAPVNVTAAPASHDVVNLTWEHATDPDTGIIEYNVYRGGGKVGTVRDPGFADTGLAELTLYDYEVKAVNFHGTEGAADSDSVTTPPDVSPPVVATVSAGGDPLEVAVIFDEPVEQVTAETATNYTISGGVTVSAASLGGDLKTVALTTSAQTANSLYTIDVTGVLDRAASPNASAAQSVYTYGASAGLVGYWRLDEAGGVLAADTSGFGNDGIRLENPTPADGRIDGGLDFDGIDDNVEIDLTPSLNDATRGTFTVAAWVRCDRIPPNTTASNGVYTFFEGPYWQLYYGYDRRFAGRLGGGYQNPMFELKSDVLAPGTWRHLAMVKDNVAKKLYFYVDGVPVAGSPKTFTGDPVGGYVEALPEGTAHK